MARYLKDVSIHLGFGQRLPEGFEYRDFNITTHTVQDIFRYMLPKRFEFGNILKLNIEIKGNDESVNEALNFNGYVNYSSAGFDFDEYFKLSKQEQNNVILKILRDVLDKITVDNIENKKIAFNMIDQIKELNFDYTFKSKLSKLQRIKKYKAIVEIRVNDDGQNAFLKIENQSGEMEIECHLLKNNVYEFHNNLYKSKWNGDVFQIIDREGNVFKEIEM
ncbi:MAG: hypothetical protein ACJASQ_002442 [Crocinitomicaceae bacterium]|jgi:hypothetical protein